MTFHNNIPSHTRATSQKTKTYGLSLLLALTLVLLVLPASVFAIGVYVDEDGNFEKQTLMVPYPFWNETFGAAVGFSYGLTGFPQEQSALIGSAMVGSTGSGAVYLLGRDINLPMSNRLFFDTVASLSYASESDVYSSGNPNFAGQRAGANDSDADNFIQGKGWDNLLNLRFKYLLPIGHGKNQIIEKYYLKDGMLLPQSQKDLSWNPFTSGKTFIEFTPFYRYLEISGSDIDDYETKTNGLELALYWDNRDFPANPTMGNSLLLKMTNDFGWLDSTESWLATELEFDKYFSLGETENFRQRVLAFDFWSSYSPSWDVEDDGTISNRPPPFAGATLGGLFKMRGYPAQRFNDKAAVYYSTELRLIPKWNPFDEWNWIQKHVGVEWVQIVPFFELGRVAPSWNIDELHSDMKWSSGLGIRLWAKGLVVRVDTAFSDEDIGVQMMVSQPFQF